jgi:diketogulonate reductase-like aldo/keto reductase
MLQTAGRRQRKKNRKAEFDFETKTVMLNSGYEMPVGGLGTYSLHGDECMNSVKSALSNGVRLIDTASAYGNEEEIGQAIRAVRWKIRSNQSRPVLTGWISAM